MWNLYVRLLKFNNINVKIAVKSENVDRNPGFCFHNHLLLFSHNVCTSSRRDKEEQVEVEVIGFYSWKGSSKSYSSGIS